MKKLLICLMVVVCLLGLAGTSFGSNGKAIIPSVVWNYSSSNNNTIPYILVTNITDTLITITVTIYNPDGTILHSGLYSNNVSDFNSSLTDASASFTLAPNVTGGIYVNNSNITSSVFGYGRISWNNDSTTTQNGVMAHTYLVKTSNGAQTIVPIFVNSGLPF